MGKWVRDSYNPNPLDVIVFDIAKWAQTVFDGKEKKYSKPSSDQAEFAENKALFTACKDSWKTWLDKFKMEKISEKTNIYAKDLATTVPNAGEVLNGITLTAGTIVRNLDEIRKRAKVFEEAAQKRARIACKAMIILIDHLVNHFTEQRWKCPTKLASAASTADLGVTTTASDS